MRRCLGFLAIGLVLLGACSPDPLLVPEGCNPLAAELDCLLPFPSDHFLVPDPTLASGFRVRIDDAALVHTPEGEPLDLTRMHPADGWSFAPAIFALMPGAIDDANLIFHSDDVLSTLRGEGPTILISEHGDPVLHFAELDPRPEDPARRALFVRPMVRLEETTRYVVAFRNLRGPDGELLPPPEGFLRIRDGKTRGDPVLDPIASTYEETVFPILKQAGFSRKSLQLAWAFTTRSEAEVTRDMRAVRAAVMAAFETEGPAVTVRDVVEDPASPWGREVRGTLTVPLFLEKDLPGSMLHRDGEGRVIQNGTFEVPFLAVIPPSRIAAARPGRVIQFGHGFFGSRAEVRDGFAPAFAEQLSLVMIAVDWQGMSRGDSLVVAGDVLGDVSRATRFAERLHQGMANQLALAYAIRGGLLAEPAFRVAGQPLYDPERLYFYGISNGHILGGTFLALSPFHQRAVGSVGGAGYNFMMFRAGAFAGLLGLLATPVPDLLDQQKVTALMQLSLDRIDPLTYAPHVLQSPWPGSARDRKLLFQIGLGDTSVPNLASHLHARALGISRMVPGPRSVPQIPEARAPFAGSALVEFDLGIPEPLPGTFAQLPTEDNIVHGAVRMQAAGIAQIDAFLRPGGLIEQTCDGACDPD